MRAIIYLAVISLLSSCMGRTTGDDAALQELYVQLDNEIADSRIYELAKEQRIAQLHKSYVNSSDAGERVDIVNRLIGEFEAYSSDSTLKYINLNLAADAVKDKPGEYTRLLIKRADVLAHAGFFPDALAAMEAIPRDSLRAELMEDYYSTYCATYQYLSEYASAHETAADKERLRAVYADSLCRVTRPGSFNSLTYVLCERARKGDTDTAIKELTRHLDEYASGSRRFSILASTLAYIYKIAGNEKEYKRYLVLSAISDVKGAVKENMSFREVAAVMFEAGDVERANSYLKKSIADANFYSALMRGVQSSKMLPLIDDAYASRQKQSNRRLSILVWTTSILSIVLVITIMLILKQFKSLHRANAEVRSANEELSSMSERLKKANEELEERNYELRDFNKTKEQYAGLFMEYCSSAISTLQHYQQSLRVLTASGGNRASLLKKLESTEIADQLLKNFYIKFDEAVLNIYPSFVDKFNSLLKPGEQVVLKSGELLNTELRLFALVRIGIDDSAKIADFLRCSLATVYTYRSKMRRRALKPDSFENDVKNIP